MVYVNSKKFACESCIKGHRSSSCHHNDRPLFEVKKKGRPVSQCEKCRELRQSKRVHSKCTCNDREDSAKKAEPVKALGIKPKRFIPITPALPNGLQDVLKASRVSGSPANVRQRVESLLNPCHCRDVWKCNCKSSSLSGSQGQTRENSGLGVLAQAAEAFENPASTSALPVGPRKAHKRLSRNSSPNGNNNSSHKRTKHGKTPPHTPGPHLPPIHLETTSSSSACPAVISSFDMMPPMSAIQSLAGSGCTCGLQCACPGCIEHRGPDHALTSHKDCADGCGTCVDHSAGISLPSLSGASSSSSILDRFFARAAALPPPPTNRRMGMGIEFDPMNVTVYPDMVRADNDRAIAFGLITIPRLECCGGSCGCPEGRCGCGKACNGCCHDHYATRNPDSTQIRGQPSVESSSPPEPSIPSMTPVRSCCAGKVPA